MRLPPRSVATRGLDRSGLKTYSETMFGKVVAGVFLSLWFVLFTVEFSEDMGLINYDEPDMDHCVEATLASLGEAIKISDDLQMTVYCGSSAALAASYPSIASRQASFQYLTETTEFFKPDIPIYTLHQTFLI